MRVQRFHQQGISPLITAISAPPVRCLRRAQVETLANDMLKTVVRSTACASSRQCAYAPWPPPNRQPVTEHARRERRHRSRTSSPSDCPSGTPARHQQPQDVAVAVGKIHENSDARSFPRHKWHPLRTHPLLDKRRAGFETHHRRPARRRHHCLRVRVRRGSWIIFAPGCFPETLPPAARRCSTLDKLPFLIEQEAAVEVAVERRYPCPPRVQ